MVAWLFLLVTMAACASAPASDGTTLPSGPTPVGAVTDQRIEMRVGASVRIEGTDATLTFVRVASDSRCPVGVSCVWEGDAVVDLRVRSGSSAAETLQLHTNDGFAREGRAAGVTVRLEGLTPHPSADAAVPAGDYVATLAVTGR